MDGGLRMKAVFATGAGPAAIENAYDQRTRAELAQCLEFVDGWYDPRELGAPRLREVEILFSTWGMFELEEAKIREHLPKLQAIFYAAGSVQYFARPYLACGVRIFSAWAANGVPVAEFTLAQILLANKGYFQAARRYKAEGFAPGRDYAEGLDGNYGATVGVIGAGMIGRMVIGMLKRYDLRVLVCDPFLSAEQAQGLGAEQATLERIFTESQTITNHVANNEKTRGMLDYRLFSRMRPNATFINTGRGAQVVEADLARALREEPRRTALLDVTDPEPLEPDSPFAGLDNVWISPHIAGSMSGEVARMGRYMAEAFRELGEERGRYEVTEAMLETMA